MRSVLILGWVTWGCQLRGVKADEAEGTAAYGDWGARKGKFLQVCKGLLFGICEPGESLRRKVG